MGGTQQARPGRGRAVGRPTEAEDKIHLPDSVRGFTPMPLKPFTVPALAIASTGDPYVSVPRAQEFAQDWGAEFCNAVEPGHINSASRLEFSPQTRCCSGSCWRA